MLSRRQLLEAAAALSIAAPSITLAKASHATTKPTRFLVGFPPGSALDAVARLLVEHLRGYAPSLIVENKVGAGGRLALEEAKAAVPDGSTMVLTPVDQLALFPHVYARLGYRALEDFIPVTTVCSVEFLLVVGRKVSSNVSSVAEFIDWCRANKGDAFYGTPGVGTHPHFLGFTLARAANLELTHAPYKGGPPIVQDLLGGHLASSIATIGLLRAHVDTGSLRALATTAPRRSKALPSVPTFKQLGYPMLESIERFGVLVPARTHQEHVMAIYNAIHNAMQTETFKAKLSDLSLELAESSPSEFAMLIHADTQRWAGIVKASGFKQEE